MEQRRITETAIAAVLSAPARVVAGAAPGTYQASGALADGRELVVVYRPLERGRRLVITVYNRGEGP